MTKENKEKRSIPQKIELKRKGTGDFLRVPADWRNTIPGLQGHLVFDATVEKDEYGIIYLVFKKVSEPCRQT